MKHRAVFFLAVLAASVMSVSCNIQVAETDDEVVFEEEKPDDYVEWDSQYWDSTYCYLLLVKKECDTVIRFDYRVGKNMLQQRCISGTAVNKYGWLACEFIECGGDTLIPADEYWWEDSVSLGIRIGMQDDRYAVVVSDSKAWASPMLIKEEPVYP